MFGRKKFECSICKKGTNQNCRIEGKLIFICKDCWKKAMHEMLAILEPEGWQSETNDIVIKSLATKMANLMRLDEKTREMFALEEEA